jgi:predicted metal-dependent phosphotriesterase family hydrolase
MHVNTVLGPVDASQLGVVLTHEHLWIDLYRVNRFRERILNDVDLVSNEVEKFKAEGGSTIMDVTTPDLARNPAALQEISRRTGVHVVMGAGRYREGWYEPDLWQRTAADLGAEFARDVEVGVDGIKAGFFGEIGVDGYHLSPIEERIHRGVAKAHVRTGAPITTHAIGSPVGLEQLDLFEEERVDLRRVAVGHCDSYPFYEYHVAIAQRQAYVQFDLIRGLPGYEYEEIKQIESIKRLADDGYLDRILLSHDICDLQKLTVNGGPGYAYVLQGFVPKLRAAGLSSGQLDRILIENPRRLLAGSE